MPHLPPAEYRSRSRLLSYPVNVSLFANQYELPFESVFHDVLVDSYDGTIQYTDAFLEQLLDDLEVGEADENEGGDDRLDHVTWARNDDPAVVIRGQNWRFEWRPDSQRVERRDDGTWEKATVPELELIGRELLEMYVEAERERGRVLEATESIAGQAAL
ncbi:hypothetical protein [Natronorubrum daqingense]|uniref:Uncharacterized protein n=1 Tax=Natronorubrum daqingense TaxID=588898 RepID=A0A1P8R9N5_9EURY|nr:hypothetical protein [Natronorubrum daqingense]APX95242.1 hypothetical protein BB347_00715 [Natronorubrum daqingense]